MYVYCFKLLFFPSYKQKQTSSFLPTRQQLSKLCFCGIEKDKGQTPNTKIKKDSILLDYPAQFSKRVKKVIRVTPVRYLPFNKSCFRSPSSEVPKREEIAISDDRHVIKLKEHTDLLFKNKCDDIPHTITSLRSGEA